MAWSLATTRSVFEHRAVVAGVRPGELAAGLAALAAGEPAAVASAGLVAAGVAAGRKVVFVFPGQGASGPGWAGSCTASCPVFAARLAECGRALAPWVDWSLADVLAGAEGAPGLEAGRRWCSRRCGR